MVADLPSPARRWLGHAIAPGTPLFRRAAFSQHGVIRIGRWRQFDADWLLASGEGFVWRARTRFGILPVRGADYYVHGSGGMDWRLLGLVPFLRAAGPDIDRSAAGRLAAELCFVPAAMLGPSVGWQALDQQRAVALIDIGGYTHHVTVCVASSGALRWVELGRWGNPGGAEFRRHTFTARFARPQRTFDGFTVPSAVSAGWWNCPDECADEAFFRATIDHGRYF